MDRSDDHCGDAFSGPRRPGLWRNADPLQAWALVLFAACWLLVAVGALMTWVLPCPG